MTKYKGDEDGTIYRTNVTGRKKKDIIVTIINFRPCTPPTHTHSQFCGKV